MTRTSWGSTSATSNVVRGRPRRAGRRRSPAAIAFGAVATGALLLGACGGDDDDTAGDSGSTTSLAASPATDPPALVTTTLASVTTTTSVVYVTEGASLIVANASGINGAAGRMSGRLAEVGFTTGDAANSTEGQLATSKIYYDPANAAAKGVADSLRSALGGGEITVVEIGTPPPVDTGGLGDASILLAMGNDIADKSLEELQGLQPPAADDTSDTGDAGDVTTTTG